MQAWIEEAAGRRAELVAAATKTPHPKGAFRLFDGFRESGPKVVLDVYGSTLVVFDHLESDDASASKDIARAVMARIPTLRTAVRKPKAARDPEARRGEVIAGEERDLCRAIEEDGVRYAVRLLLHHDAGFYLDTRNLRSFVRANASGARVLNAFAYTGSVGVAARAGGARAVVQTDRSKTFLNVAKDSYALNGFPVERASFIAADFFEVMSRLRKADELFDLVVVDPPLFSESPKGRVDLTTDFRRLVDKARPLVAHDGRLVVVNNALFVSGADLMTEIDAMAAEGYAKLESTIPVPDDCAPPIAASAPPQPSDPAPFNHPTKIAVLRLERRDGRTS